VASALFSFVGDALDDDGVEGASAVAGAGAASAENGLIFYLFMNLCLQNNISFDT
jgi:hypothetical protein